MPKPSQRRYCFQCRHFRNSPEYLETVFKGLTSLSSAYGSVRVEDGICLLNDRYLAANRHCDRFEAHPASAHPRLPDAAFLYMGFHRARPPLRPDASAAHLA